MALIAQEVSAEPWIDVPGEVLDILRLWRPDAAGAGRAARARARHPGAHLLQGRVGVARRARTRPTPSVPQAFYNQAEGIARLATETGAGQWGTRAVVRVRAVRPRVQGLHGAGVVRAEAVPQDPDGDVGRVGRAVTGRRARPPRLARPRDQRRGARRRDRATTRTTRSARCSTTCCCTRPSSGSRRRSSSQLAGEERPDVVIGSCGGGSNLGGIALPFVPDTDVRLVAVEPSSCPTLTEGSFDYDFGDTAGMTPLLPMYTLGHDFVPPSIHAGGLRYHGDSPIISQPGAVRAHGGGRLPAGQDVRGRGAVRPRRGQDPRARDRPRHPRRRSTRRWRRRRPARSA